MTTIQPTLTLPLLTDYTWRAARREDAPALYRYSIDMDAADDTTYAGEPDEIQRDFDDPASSSETDTLIAVTPEGQVAALGWVFLDPQAERQRRAFLWGGVHPQHRRRGLGSAMLRWLERRGIQRLSGYQDELPRRLQVNAPSTAADRIHLFEQHGFEARRYYFKMRRDLSLASPAQPVPTGLRLVNWTLELDEAVREATNEAFRDHWGSEPLSAERWALHFTHASTFHPELSFVALDGEQVAGACLCQVHTEDNARQGLREGWIDSLAVRRSWRGRGLAASLLDRSMSSFKTNGMEYAGLFVDTENLTGALRLYNRLSFRAVQRTIAYYKDM